MIDVLRQYTPDYLQWYGGQAVPQVQSVLAKLALCRTPALGEHSYQCPQCQYRLLFHAAWQALREVLQEELGCEPAALLVLHTWNQRMEHHPHLHAVVPGGGPSADGQRWIRSRHRRHRRRRRPYLVDHRLLSERFRDKFLAGLTRLHRRGELKLQGSWSRYQDPAAFEAWLETFRDVAWVVFIQPPPKDETSPEHVLKYLARYLTGGPISDRRLIEHEAGEVTFWARSPDKKSGNKSEPYTLPGAEFTRRWALHILPKGFVKSRCFGGFSCRQRGPYLERCRELLAGEPVAGERPTATLEEPVVERVATHVCPHCQTPLECLSRVQRPGWNRVLNGPDRPAWYDPFGHALAWGGLHWYRQPPDG